MKKVAVILQYYGELKPSFALWYESARRNSDIDFFIFTDNKEPRNPANNIKWTEFSLSDFNRLAVKKLGVDFSITYPYKLCDFKPLYGAVFEDYIKGYEYWAFGDLDVIYGNISGYLDSINYKKYSKINHAGHFCIMKNTPEAVNLFKADVPGTNGWLDILESENRAFDEIDMNKKASAKGIAFYNGIFAADLMNEKGMQVVDGERIKKNFKIANPMGAPKNYRYQIFVTENGRILRYYRRRFKVLSDEFCYIHYRLELPVYIKDKNADTYLFSYYPKGFFDIDVSQLKNLRCFMKTVKAYNRRRPFAVEKVLAVINIAKKRLKGRGK